MAHFDVYNILKDIQNIKYALNMNVNHIDSHSDECLGHHVHDHIHDHIHDHTGDEDNKYFDTPKITKEKSMLEKCKGHHSANFELR